MFLVLACLLPGIIGAAGLFIYQYREGRAQREHDTIQTARALVQAVDNHLLRAQAVAQALSVSESLARRDFASFYRQAREVLTLSGLGTNIVLRDEETKYFTSTSRATERWYVCSVPFASHDRRKLDGRSRLRAAGCRRTQRR
ncbi:MAG: hypothetical protein ACM3Y9_15290 [Ignavibacteria bacterium]